MTVAVCLKCGAMKVGAFTPCIRCHFMPETPEDQARSILLSDHNMNAAALEDVGRRIEKGDQPKFDEAAIARMAAQVEQAKNLPAPGRAGCLVMQWGLVALMFVLLVAVIYLFWHLKHSR